MIAPEAVHIESKLLTLAFEFSMVSMQKFTPVRCEYCESQRSPLRSHADLLITH
jgi:hypothetical protein